MMALSTATCAVAMGFLLVNCQDSQSATCDSVNGSSLFETALRCAEEGYTTAQYYVGYMYHSGEGTPENFAEAVSS